MHAARRSGQRAGERASQIPNRGRCTFHILSFPRGCPPIPSQLAEKLRSQNKGFQVSLPVQSQDAGFSTSTPKCFSTFHLNMQNCPLLFCTPSHLRMQDLPMSVTWSVDFLRSLCAIHPQIPDFEGCIVGTYSETFNKSSCFQRACPSFESIVS